jgi:predicted  nucleic acid-binding Zn-ribbon protein
MKALTSIISIIIASPAFSENVRQLNAHEHGIAALNIAIEAPLVVMEFHAPGADIVGFEYAAKSDADFAAISAALKTLEAPLDLFVLPKEARCAVQEVQVELESDADHDVNEEDHQDHDDENDHKHEDHDDHDEEKHAASSGHTEFHAEYSLICSNIEALTQIDFAYFEVFPNSKQVELQLISQSGARVFDIERSAPRLDLGL